MFKTSCLLVFVAANFAGILSRGISRDDAFPFGLDKGDNMLAFNPPKDTNSTFIHLETPILFGTHTEKGLYLHSSGAISFRDDNAPLNETGICGDSKKNFRGLMPYLSSIRQTVDSRIYYRESNDSKLLQKAADEVVNAYPIWEGLKLKRIFIATWFNVRPEPNHACSNTFQVVLGTDGVFTFAIYNYIELEWPGQHRCRDTPKSVRVGYDNKEGHRHELSVSCQNNATALQQTSNVNIPGKYIFRIDNAGLSFLSWAYYYVQSMWGVWMWSGLFLSFSLGTLMGLCCVACCTCCCASSKKKSTRRSHYRRQHDDEDIRVRTVGAPPTYAAYPDDFLPPKY